VRALALTLLLAAAFHVQAPRYRTLNDRFEPPQVTTRAAWTARARYIREHVLVSAGLVPMPAKTPLNAVVFDEVLHQGDDPFSKPRSATPSGMAANRRPLRHHRRHAGRRRYAGHRCSWPATAPISSPRSGAPGST